MPSPVVRRPPLRPSQISGRDRFHTVYSLNDATTEWIFLFEVLKRMIRAVARQCPDAGLFRRAAQAGHDLRNLRVGFFIEFLELRCE